MPPTSSRLGSVLLTGLPKSGTSMLTKVFQMACQAAGVTHLPVHDQLYSAGIEPTAAEQEQLRELFLPKGYCYGAFRHAFSYLSAATDMPTIWLRRDPKDVIVSRYFSQAYSHAAPGGDAKHAFASEREQVQKTAIEAFVIQEVERQAQLARTYLDIIPASNLHVFWYEDIIYKKREWIEQMMALCGWQLSSEQINAIVTEVDVIPTTEDPKAFVRQVHPGNHQKHLSPATSDHIDAFFKQHVPEWTR